MNILLVDDQPEVLYGVLTGVRWEQLDIGERFTATDIFAAQDIIRNHRIELLLCDIEMPLGSGLELYQWVIENQYRIKCIFLTAHSDFSYMQSAIQMQGFDYLLQPASFEQIENSIRKAIDQIKLEQVIDDYYKYGIALKKQENTALEGVLRNYLLKYEDSRTLSGYFQAISIPLSEAAPCDCILLQVMDWNNRAPWQPHLFQYAVGNVVRELFPLEGMQLYVVALSGEMYCLIAFPVDPGISAVLRQSLEEFLDLCPQQLGCSVACYQGQTAPFDRLPDLVESTRRLAARNVARRSGFFTYEDLQREGVCYVPPDFGRWDTLEQEGLYGALGQEMQSYLHHQTVQKNVNAEFLRLLHQDVIYWFAHALSRHNIRAHEVFNQDTDAAYNYEAMMNSYAYVERMRALLKFMCNYLASCDRNLTVKSHVESVEEYIRQNIQKNITRKELADAVYLNPEYLSRLFKKEKGCTISEYMTREKMFLARSLLETTNFSVSMIASKVGYSNFSHFAQCFKKEFGISPSEIRKK